MFPVSINIDQSLSDYVNFKSVKRERNTKKKKKILFLYSNEDDNDDDDDDEKEIKHF
jgi:hypothetical protein